MGKRDELRAWIIKMRDDGYDTDKIKCLLLNNGHALPDIDAALIDASRQNDTPSEQSMNIEKLINNIRAGLLNYDLFSHGKKMAYVLKNPRNFIPGLRRREDDADVSLANAFTFSCVNILIFSATKSLLSFSFNIGIISVVIDMIYLMLFSSVALFVSGYAAYRMIIFLGGTGRFSDTIFVFCYSSAALAFFGLPYVWVIPAVYALVLLDFNLSSVHNTKKMIPFIAIIFLVCISAIVAGIIHVLIGTY